MRKAIVAIMLAIGLIVAAAAAGATAPQMPDDTDEQVTPVTHDLGRGGGSGFPKVM